MLGGGEVEPFPSLIFSFDGSFLVLHLSSFSATKNITPEFFNKKDFFFDVGCFLFSKREERGLWPVSHIKVNKFYIRTAYFFGGVIFCGEELWEKGGGSVFFLFFCFFFFFVLLSVSFPFRLCFLLGLLVLFDLA